MGGGGSTDWLALRVTVQGRRNSNNTAFTFSRRNPINNTSLAAGANNDPVLYNNGGNFFVSVAGGAKLTVSRTGMVDNVQCVGANEPHPPGCAGGTQRRCGPVNKYSVNGTQVLVMRRMKATLQVTPSSQTTVQGDAVTFTASSTDGRAVSVREWLFRDSTGVTSSAGCAATGTTCTIVASSSGSIYVRARVGTNSYIEQAMGELMVTPLQFTASVYYSPVAAGDSALLLVSVIPNRTLTSLSVSIPGICTPGTKRCKIQIDAPGAVAVSASGSGFAVSTTVTVDTLSCPTGDDEMDNPLLRQVIAGMMDSTGYSLPNASRRERAAYLYEDANGVQQVRWEPLPLDASPCKVGTVPSISSWLPAGGKLLTLIHSHPFRLGHTVGSECPEIAGTTYSNKNTGGPSPGDWASLTRDAGLYNPNLRGLVIGPDYTWTMSPIPSTQFEIIQGFDALGNPVSEYKPKKSAWNNPNYRREFKRQSSCFQRKFPK
jgi:hypothetical protein